MNYAYAQIQTVCHKMFFVGEFSLSNFILKFDINSCGIQFTWGKINIHIRANIRQVHLFYGGNNLHFFINDHYAFGVILAISVI